TEKGIYILNLENEKFTPFSQLQNKVIYDIHKDRQGILWIATRNDGLFRYDPKAEKLKNYRSGRKHNTYSLSSNQIRSITEDKAGNIWLGAYGGGVDRLDPVSGNIQNYTTENSGLSNSNILNVYADLSDNIW